MILKPKKLELKNWKQWLRDSLELMLRKPIAFLMLTGLALLVAHGFHLVSGTYDILHPVHMLHPIVTALIAGLGCLVAESADKSQNPLSMIMDTPRGCWKNILSAGALPILVVLLVVAVLKYSFGEATAFTDKADTTIRFFALGVETINRYGELTVIFSAILIGLPNLIINLQLDIKTAISQSIQALLLNKDLLLLVCIMLLIIAEISRLGFLVFVILPFMFCFLYVIYREIWFGPGKNKAVKKPLPLKIMPANAHQGEPDRNIL